jgi:uncharacterized protein YndB with AHSA1/START domain
MAHANDSIVINTDPETLWSLLTVPDQILQWTEGVDTINATADYPNKGSSFAWTYKVAGLNLKGTYRVTEVTPGEKIHYTIEGFVNGTQDWDLSQSGKAIKVDVVTDYEMSGGVLGKIAEPVVHQTNAGNLKKSLANLKKMAEGG